MADMPGNGYSIASAGIGAAGGILGGLLEYFGMQDQLKFMKQQSAQNQANFETQTANENQQFGQTLGENKRQFNATSALNQQVAGQNYQLQNRGYDIQEKGINLSIAEQRRARAEALKQKKLDDSLALLGHMTTFFNTPQARAQFANVWAGR